ncbi:type III toxin-antitoxin system ToxN/AbiQ family toxin [Staphylococcus delphini]|uniref:type III toxin-antitoxin system ToxN/AbiQ family toxin n=1 Tax=Staphylococcus delphini TaxID=53344 RepID=UPI000F6BA7FC|nr:type III toxin-antitoxin system ToxN/AbiQ family toxin [Staphylococcus delphini]VED61913.1 Uncharacterised protein [Staphylococcus delphini]
MKLYYVNAIYVNKLRNIDSKVLFNKSTRPYLRIVLTIHDINYFVPLGSAKDEKK